MRLENIGDKFDEQNQTVYIEVETLANNLWNHVNPEEALNGVTIEELTLSANQKFSEAKA